MRHHTFNKIAMLRRHFGIKGEDLMAAYDTAIAAHQPLTEVKYVTLSTSREIWDRLAENPNIERAKHPGTNVECLKMFGNLYLRKQNRVPDEDIVWAPGLGCYTPGNRYLYNHFQNLIMSSSSTKKVIAYAEGLTSKLRANIKAVEVND